MTVFVDNASARSVVFGIACVFAAIGAAAAAVIVSNRVTLTGSWEADRETDD